MLKKVETKTIEGGLKYDFKSYTNRAFFESRGSKQRSSHRRKRNDINYNLIKCLKVQVGDGM